MHLSPDNGRVMALLRLGALRLGALRLPGHDASTLLLVDDRIDQDADAFDVDLAGVAAPHEDRGLARKADA